MAAVPAPGPPPQSPEVLEPILTPARFNQRRKRGKGACPADGRGRGGITEQPSAGSTPGLRGLRCSWTNLPVPLSGYLGLSLPGKGHDDGMPAVSTSSFRCRGFLPQNEDGSLCLCSLCRHSQLYGVGLLTASTPLEICRVSSSSTLLSFQALCCLPRFVTSSLPPVSIQLTLSAHFFCQTLELNMKPIFSFVVNFKNR